MLDFWTFFLPSIPKTAYEDEKVSSVLLEVLVFQVIKGRIHAGLPGLLDVFVRMMR